MLRSVLKPPAAVTPPRPSDLRRHPVEPSDAANAHRADELRTRQYAGGHILEGDAVSVDGEQRAVARDVDCRGGSIEAGYVLDRALGARLQ